MAFSSPVPRTRRARRSASRVAALALLAAALWHTSRWGATYVVKGSWEGQPGGTFDGVKKGEFGTVLQGLEPNVTFPEVEYGRGGVSFAVSKGHLVADYAGKVNEDTALNFRIDDEQDWTAALAGHDATLKVKGHGTEWGDLRWEASQASAVKDVGDVKVEFNSEKEYNLTINRPSLATIAGVDIGAKVKATHAGVTGRLGAKRLLPQGVEVSYSVENPVGVYDVTKSHHVGRLSAPIAKGLGVVQAAGNADSKAFDVYYETPLGEGVANVSLSQVDGVAGYNVSYAIDHKFGGKVPADVGTVVGVDEAGVYGKLTAREDIGNGIAAIYDAAVRVALDESKKKDIRHSLKLANDLGYVQLLHGTGEPVRVRAGYEFDA